MPSRVVVKDKIIFAKILTKTTVVFKTLRNIEKFGKVDVVK